MSFAKVIRGSLVSKLMKGQSNYRKVVNIPGVALYHNLSIVLYNMITNLIQYTLIKVLDIYTNEGPGIFYKWKR